MDGAGAIGRNADAVGGNAVAVGGDADGGAHAPVAAIHGVVWDLGDGYEDMSEEELIALLRTRDQQLARKNAQVVAIRIKFRALSAKLWRASQARAKSG
jgi:hypothetical protein